MVLANSLKRIWSATSRVPHQTRWGTRGLLASTTGGIGLSVSLYEGLLAFRELAHRTVPTILVIVWNIFR